MAKLIDAAPDDRFKVAVLLASDAAWPLQHAIAMACAWCVVIIAITMPLALRRFRLRTTG